MSPLGPGGPFIVFSPVTSVIPGFLQPLDISHSNPVRHTEQCSFSSSSSGSVDFSVSGGEGNSVLREGGRL